MLPTQLEDGHEKDKDTRCFLVLRRRAKLAAKSQRCRTDKQVESMRGERGTPEMLTLADAVRAEDRQVLARVAAAPIIPLKVLSV
jgi:hypothetical protein